MPLYHYKCKEHGVFQALATLADYQKPCACPRCGIMSGRVLVLPPEIRLVNKELRQAMERNEKASEAPMIVRAGKKSEEGHKHGKECSHAASRQLFYTADGNKTFPFMRPWMISH